VSRAELPVEVVRLLENSVPTIDALEVLLALVRQGSLGWAPDELAESVRAVEVTESTTRQYLALLQAQGFLAERDGRWRYHPSSPELAGAVGALMAAYNERPVTLIRTVYAIADSKRIQSFADAFKLKKNP